MHHQNVFPHHLHSPRVDFPRIFSVSLFDVQAVEENANESEDEFGSEEEEDGSSAKPKPAAKRTGGSKLKGAARGKK
jgi:hypothetical protein